MIYTHNNTINGTFYSAGSFVLHYAIATFLHKQANTVKCPLLRRYMLKIILKTELKISVQLITILKLLRIFRKLIYAN